MKRAAFLLVFAAAAHATAAGMPALAGQAAFAGSQGQIAFEAGLLDMGVDQIRFDDILILDGVEFGQRSIDRIDGSVFGGTLTFVLPGEDQSSWLGRRLRLKAQFGRQKGDATKTFLGEATATSDVLGLSVSPDGRAAVRLEGTSSSGSFLARVYGASSSDTDSCAGTNGAMTYDAVVTGVSAYASCQTGPPDAVSFFGVSDGGATNYVIFAGGAILAGPQTLAFSLTEARSISVRRGEVALEGDYDVTPDFAVSPSVGLTFGKTTASFEKVEEINGDFARALSGGTVSQDAGFRLGGRATYRAGRGFDVFGSASGAVVRRVSDMQSQSLGGVALIFVEDAAGDAKAYQAQSDVRGAFLADVTLGAAYLFETQALGPLRLAVSGGLSYDSAVATYGNAGATPTVDVTAGPLSPAYIAYSGQTTLSVKAEIGFELP